MHWGYLFTGCFHGRWRVPLHTQDEGLANPPGQVFTSLSTDFSIEMLMITVWNTVEMQKQGILAFLYVVLQRALSGSPTTPFPPARGVRLLQTPYCVSFALPRHGWQAEAVGAGPGVPLQSGDSSSAKLSLEQGFSLGTRAAELSAIPDGEEEKSGMQPDTTANIYPAKVKHSDGSEFGCFLLLIAVHPCWNIPFLQFLRGPKGSCHLPCI